MGARDKEPGGNGRRALGSGRRIGSGPGTGRRIQSMSRCASTERCPIYGTMSVAVEDMKVTVATA